MSGMLPFSWVFKFNIQKPRHGLVAAAVKTIFTVLVEKLLVGRQPRKADKSMGSIKKRREHKSEKGYSPAMGLFRFCPGRLPFQAIIVTGMLTLVGTNKSGKDKSPES